MNDRYANWPMPWGTFLPSIGGIRKTLEDQVLEDLASTNNEGGKYETK